MQYFVGILVVLFLLFLTGSIRFIPNNRVGVREKLFGLSGSLKEGLIALKGETGFEPDVLRGGWHFMIPLQYRVHVQSLVTIGQGKIGYVFARDGVSLSPSQSLAANTIARDFENVRAFFANGGQKGPQRRVLREGTYAINLAQFVVITENQIHFLPLDKSDQETFERMTKLILEREGFSPVVISADAVGVVTVHDGPALPSGEIIAPTVGDAHGNGNVTHNSFQDPDLFLELKGFRGRQLQALVEGTYYINRLFATVEFIPKTVVEVGTVGVVVSYTGDRGIDVSGTEYSHGEMVNRGNRGVWSEPLLPGKYAFNTYAGKVILVPTTNIILKWIRSERGSHLLDENLSEVKLITKDAFEPNLPLSVVIHIDYRKAPLVIQRFGDIKRLVEQTLDPMVAAYFKNIGQTRTIIELIQDRSAIQLQSLEEMKVKFSSYNLELQEVLIGTPSSEKGDQTEVILQQLRARQIAQEQIETYTRQQSAAVQERTLREAEAKAKQQTHLTESELSITVQGNQGKAEYARSQQQAAQIKTLAEAEASRLSIIAEGEARKIRSLAEAEAEKAARIGVAQALAIEEQVRAYGGAQFQLLQQVMNRFAQAIETSKVEVVPRVSIVQGQGGTSGGNSASGGGVLESMLSLLLSDRIAQMSNGEPSASLSPEAKALRETIQQQMSKPGSTPLT